MPLSTHLMTLFYHRHARAARGPAKVPGIKVTMAEITMFQDQSANPLVAHLKGNISSRSSSSSQIVLAMSIFDPRNAKKRLI